MRLSLSQIRLDGGTQTRAEVDLAVASDYADAFKAGATFPPVVVFYDGTDHWLADGFHRVTGAKSALMHEIDADVRQGTRRDAILFSVGANASHGLRRTNADKRRAVETLLRDEEWRGWSDGVVAGKCGVSDRYVAKVRAEVTPNGSECEPRKTADGRVMNTANIGKAPKVEPVPVEVDTPDVEREPDVYEPEPAPIRRDPPPRTGWGASEVATFTAETIIACRDFQAQLAARFATVDPRFLTEARARVEAALSETIEAIREFVPTGTDRAPRFNVIKGGK